MSTFDCLWPPCRVKSVRAKQSEKEKSVSKRMDTLKNKQKNKILNLKIEDEGLSHRSLANFVIYELVLMC